MIFVDDNENSHPAIEVNTDKIGMTVPQVMRLLRIDSDQAEEMLDAAMEEARSDFWDYFVPEKTVEVLSPTFLRTQATQEGEDGQFLVVDVQIPMADWTQEQQVAWRKYERTIKDAIKRYTGMEYLVPVLKKMAAELDEE